MKHSILILVVMVALSLVLTSCDTAQPAEPSPAPTRTRAPTKSAAMPVPTQSPALTKLPAQGSIYASQVLTTSYSGALSAANQLMLGVLQLEGTANAITSEQAKTLLSLLQPLQGRTSKSDAERNTILASVEAKLTATQLNAIASLHLTQDSLQTWMQANSQGAGVGPGPGGSAPQGTPGAGPGPGGAGPGQGGPVPQGTPGAGSGQDNLLLGSLLRLLIQKSSGSRAATLPTGS
jgi:hypothetical protein